MKKSLKFISLLFLAFLLFSFNNVNASDKRQPEVKVFDASTNQQKLSFYGFDQNFMGGGRVAIGDFNNDGYGDLVVGAGPGGGPHVRIFNRWGNYLNWDIFPFHPEYKGGVDVAAGDVDGDGIDEIIASQNSFGQAWIKIYEANAEKTIKGEFIAFDQGFEGGANVTSVDIDNDFHDDIVVSTSERGGPHIRAFKYWGEPLETSYMAYEEDFKGGVDIAAADIDRGYNKEILTIPQRISGEAAKYPYEKYIEVILAEQKLKYFESGRKIGEMLTSTGLSFPTPVGTFNIYSKIRSATMAGYYGPGSHLNYNLPNVPYILKFLGPYTIHGAYWHNNFGNPMSHGCVNLSVKDSEMLYNWAEVGIPVIIHN